MFDVPAGNQYITRFLTFSAAVLKRTYVIPTNGDLLQYSIILSAILHFLKGLSVPLPAKPEFPQAVFEALPTAPETLSASASSESLSTAAEALIAAFLAIFETLSPFLYVILHHP